MAIAFRSAYYADTSSTRFTSERPRIAHSIDEIKEVLEWCWESFGSPSATTWDFELEKRELLVLEGGEFQLRPRTQTQYTLTVYTCGDAISSQFKLAWPASTKKR